jgi:hypothetical protein
MSVFLGGNQVNKLYNGGNQVQKVYRGDSLQYTTPVTDNLVLWYDGGNTQSNPGSGSIWFPLSPSSGSLTASLNNGAAFTTSNGGAVAFDGTNDYGQATSSVAFDFGTGDFSFEVWVNVVGNSAANNDGNRNATLISTIPDAGTITGWNFLLRGDATNTGTQLLTEIQRNGVGEYVRYILPSTMTKNTLYQVGMTKASGVTKFFINGVAHDADFDIGASAVNSNNNVLNIGRLNFPGYLQYLNGNIAIIRIYKGKALTSSEILQNYNAVRYKN